MTIPPEPAVEHRVVAAIDLGTHGTGFAWAEISALNEDVHNRQIHFRDRWEGLDVAYPKNLSALLLAPDGEVAAWGFDARREWHDRLQSGDTDGWGYAYAFKMALKPGGGPDVSTAHGAVDLSDPATVVRLVAAYLERIKDMALAEIGVAARYVRWCITVPAIWDDAERDLVRKAAALAGMPSDDQNLLIAVEPEAAAIYCSLRLAEILDGSGAQEHLALGAEGTRFCVVDCGGGTVDLTAHRTTLTAAGETRLVDIGAPTGGKLGSEYVNHAFRTTLLADRLGVANLAVLERHSPAGLAALEQAWETGKVTLRAELGEDGAARVTSRIRMMLPSEVTDLLDQAARDRLKEAAGGIGGRLVIEPAESQALLDTVVEEILARTEEQLAEMRRTTGLGGGEILLLIGGFARSEYLRLRVRERFAGRVTVMTPPDPAAAVLFGAVQYCYKPTLIRSRRSKLTYGFSICMPFERDRDPVEKRQKDDEGNVVCRDRFEIAARRGETVEVDEPYYLPVFPVMADQRAVEVRFHATRELDPRYVDDPGSTLLGVLEADISDSLGKPKTDRGVGLYLYFGRTTIEATAKVLSTGAQVRTSFEFRSLY